MVSVTVEGYDGFSATIWQRFPGPVREPTLFLAREGWVEGWYSSPDLKVEGHARQTGHGNFPTPSDAVLYESRTVTVHLTCWGGTREASVALAQTLSRALAQTVVLTVDDGGLSTHAQGHCQLDWEGDWSAAGLRGTLTVVCNDPRRYGQARHAYLTPGLTHAGALQWADAGACGLLWPVSFGQSEALAASAAVLEHSGTAEAWPVVYAAGFPQGFRLVSQVGDSPSPVELAYPRAVGDVPLRLDCLSRTADIGGVDVTRELTSRGFPSVRPGEPTSVSLVCEGTGSVELVWNDTYI